MEFERSYDPKKYEGEIYRQWESSGYFAPEAHQPSADNPDKREVFSIAMAPPNITGSLHMGHALEYTLSDVLVRQKRMAGKAVLWLPGTDHAGIATQNVVEKELAKEGKTRHDLGREKFIERVWAWKEKYGHVIIEQLKALGASADWSRERFTVDEGYAQAVEVAFRHYHQKGWLYKKTRVINWCPRCETSLSDLEVEYEERKDKLYYIRYPLADGSGSITVATTRPETMLGDTAVATHPDDTRYKKLVGQKAILPIQNREIPVVADDEVQKDFGTGAVKVTPAHDTLDERIAGRHNLASPQVIGQDGRMTAEAGALCAGKSVGECRKIVVAELERSGLIEKIEDYVHNVAVCYRCGGVIEPLPSLQWFLKMDELAQRAIEAVKRGEIVFRPAKWEKIYLDWLENIRDWNISRQIWWGHKIPIEGETDVLDTWFSSALWPFATLGWPRKTDDLKKYYPTNIVTNDRGIINLWDARMIFSGYEFMGQKPFGEILVHATVLTRDGKRMSKSLGTGIDPLEIIGRDGADALRFALIWQAMGTQDIRWDETAVLAGRKFANKLWNIARYITGRETGENKESHTEDDEQIIARLETVKNNIEKNITNYEFGQALHVLYDFIWHDLADKYIEASKDRQDPAVQKTLYAILIDILRLLHPFMPFVTEAIWQKLPQKETDLLMVASWPTNHKNTRT